MATTLVQDRAANAGSRTFARDASPLQMNQAAAFQDGITTTLAPDPAMTAAARAKGVGPPDAVAVKLNAGAVEAMCNHSPHSLGLFQARCILVFHICSTLRRVVFASASETYFLDFVFDGVAWCATDMCLLCRPMRPGLEH